MKTKGRVLAVAAVIVGLTVGTAGSGLAFGGWPYPGHTMRPDLEEKLAPKTEKGQVKKEATPVSVSEKAGNVPAPEVARAGVKVESAARTK